MEDPRHVEEIVVTGVREEGRGPKSDKLDAFGLAEQLRIEAIKWKVYMKRVEFGALRHRAKAYTLLVSDGVRVQNRIKSLFRSWEALNQHSTWYHSWEQVTTPSQGLPNSLAEMSAIRRLSAVPLIIFPSNA